MSESQNTNDTQEEQRQLKDPRDLKKRPRSSGKDAPDHVRVQEHGIRTTARTNVRADPEENLLTETQIEANKESVAEDYKRTEARPSAAGPNPYRLNTSREDAGGKKVLEKLIKERDENELHNSLLEERALATYAAAIGESDAEDAEVQTLGRTITTTGQKIVPKPDRLAADEKAVLPKAGTPHEEAAKESDDPLRADAHLSDQQLRKNQ